MTKGTGGFRELLRVAVALTALLYGLYVAGNALLHASWFFVWVGAAVMVCAFTTLGPSGRERVGGWARAAKDKAGSVRKLAGR